MCIKCKLFQNSTVSFSFGYEDILQFALGANSSCIIQCLGDIFVYITNIVDIFFVRLIGKFIILC